MTRTQKLLLAALLIEGIAAPFVCFYAGKKAALEELVAHPFACVPGQMVDTSSGRYACFQSVTWKEKK